MSSHYDIEMTTDDTLELDTIIEKLDNSNSLANVTEGGNHNLNVIETQTEIFDPIDSGEYKININGQTISIKVSDAKTIPDSTLPEDLVAWYRFEDDGSALDYATDQRLSANFADNTAYDLNTANDPTHQSSGGVTDFENGLNSGEYDFNNTNSEYLYNNSFPTFGDSSRTVMVWHNPDDFDRKNIVTLGSGVNRNERWSIWGRSGNYRLIGENNDYGINVNYSSGYEHIAYSYDGNGGTLNIVKNGGESTDSIDVSSFDTVGRIAVATVAYNDSREFYDGKADEVRVYNRDLSQSEINDIYKATKP